MKYGIQVIYYKENYGGDPNAKDFFHIQRVKMTSKGIVRDNYKNYYESRYMKRGEVYYTPRLGASYHFHDFTAKEYVLQHPKASNSAQIYALQKIKEIFKDNYQTKGSEYFK